MHHASPRSVSLSPCHLVTMSVDPRADPDHAVHRRIAVRADALAALRLTGERADPPRLDLEAGLATVHDTALAAAQVGRGLDDLRRWQDRLHEALDADALAERGAADEAEDELIALGVAADAERLREGVLELEI